MTGLRGGKTIERPGHIQIHAPLVFLSTSLANVSFSPCHSCISLFYLISTAICTYLLLFHLIVAWLKECVIACVFQGAVQLVYLLLPCLRAPLSRVCLAVYLLHCSISVFLCSSD